MRAVLVFPPQVSPTYVPLGVATLSSVTREHAPQSTLLCLDLNLDLWQSLAHADPAGSAYLHFVRGAEGDFFDEHQYFEHQQTFTKLEGAANRLTASVRKGLASGEWPAEVAARLDGMVAAVMATDPELVGFSLFSFGQLPWLLALADRVHAAGARVVVGGAAVGALRTADVLAACPFIEGLVSGAGETAWVALMRGVAPEQVPSLVWRGQPNPRASSAASALEFVVPDFSDLPILDYFNPVPVLPVLYSHGCSWNRCRFCAHTARSTAHQKSSASACVQTMQQLGERHGARHFYFADLLVDAGDLEALAGAIAASSVDVSFHVLSRPTADFTLPRLALAAGLGCRWISWGVESGSQRLLDIIAKGTDRRTVEHVLRTSHTVGISNLAFLIFGLPTSTDADLAETLDLTERLYDAVDAFSTTAFALFEDAVFSRRAARYGLVPGRRQVEVSVAGRPIRSRRLDFQESATEGATRPARGKMELAQWVQRRRWLGQVGFLETLPSEHYLIYVSPHSAGIRTFPQTPRPRAA